MEDSEQGPMRPLATGLDAPSAEMIQSDLEELGIAAILTGTEAEGLEIHVPTELLELARTAVGSHFRRS